MVRLIALFSRPENPAEFDAHYFGTHLPLARQMPGLRKLEVQRVVHGLTGESPYYLMAQLTFDSREALEAAMNSPEGRAGGKNLMSFARHLVTWMIAEVVD